MGKDGVCSLAGRFDRQRIGSRPVSLGAASRPCHNDRMDHATYQISETDSGFVVESTEPDGASRIHTGFATLAEAEAHVALHERADKSTG